jgi:hypothetical protein
MLSSIARPALEWLWWNSLPSTIQFDPPSIRTICSLAPEPWTSSPGPRMKLSGSRNQRVPVSSGDSPGYACTRMGALAVPSGVVSDISTVYEPSRTHNTSPGPSAAIAASMSVLVVSVHAGAGGGGGGGSPPPPSTLKGSLQLQPQSDHYESLSQSRCE